MKKLFLVGVGFAALLGGPAIAADQAVRMRPVVVAAPAFSWTGFYVGVNGGYGWNAGKGDVTGLNIEAFQGVPEGPPTADQRNLNPRGGFGGGQIGYNWQWTPRWVVGIEADFQGAGIHDSSTVVVFNPVAAGGPDGPLNAYAKTNLDWFGTVRARLGYTLNDRTLVYATGGLAFGGVKDTLSVTEISEGIPLIGTVNNNRTATGFAVGGGVEGYFTQSLSLKAEYQYIDLGSITVATLALPTAQQFKGEGPVDCCDQPIGSATLNHRYHMLRVGLNYKFGNY